MGDFAGLYILNSKDQYNMAENEIFATPTL